MEVFMTRVANFPSNFTKIYDLLTKKKVRQKCISAPPTMVVGLGVGLDEL